MSVRPATAFVLLVWAGMLVWAHVYIGTWAERFPIHDDATLWSLLPPQGALTWQRLIEPYNVHFIPLPRLLHYALYSLTGDLRAAMFLQAELLGVISLAWILVTRRVRGRTAWTDVVFPLVFLHTGNAQNLLGGFQIALTLPTVLASAIVAAGSLSPDLPRPARAGWIGLALVCLPLCGGAGDIQTPALMAWLAWVGWRGTRSAERGERSGGRILLASVGVCFASCLAGLVLVSRTAPASSPAALRDIALHAVAVLSLGIGPAARDTWPASGLFVLALAAVTTWMLVRGVRRRTAPEIGRIGLLASIAATVCLAVGLSLVRAQFGWRNGFQPRYVTLTAPLLCAVHFAWSSYGGSAGGTLVRAALALALAAALPLNVRVGQAYAAQQSRRAAELDALVRNGARASEIVRCYSEHFYPYPARTRGILQTLAREHRPPFDRGPAWAPELFDYLALDRVPTMIEAEVPYSLRIVDGGWALLARDGTRIHLAVHARETHCSARIEVPPELVGRRFSTVTRARIELAEAGGRRTLYEREIAAGPEVVELDLPPHGECELVLATESAAGERVERSWIYWMDVAIR
ncbi:MAG TPA: hypothetical protein VGR31_04090 [Planctomycetota bacterium]|jgi:hypothetical protein|nr:hypothetical protein [Planctomycetota bacterium]